MIRILLPYHLRTLAQIQGELQLNLAPPITQRRILDALESQFPALKGTLRDHGSEKRRPMIRFFACNQDLSNDPPDQPLPEKIATGQEPLYILGAIAGG
jgi:sulfur-carrier protein